MYWQTDDNKRDEFEVPEDVQDLLFKIDCKTLPLDHGSALCEQIVKYLPWIDEEPQAAIHQIHVAESANGWIRPEDPETEVLCVSRRTRMMLRLPRSRLDEVKELTGKTLDIKGHSLKVGDFSLRKLSNLTTIFARYVDTNGTRDENLFLNNMAERLLDKGIRIKKMLSGKLLTQQTPQGPLYTRKLLLSDLDVSQSLKLQEEGLGDKMLMGMGIFLPHKGIDAVNQKQGE